MVLLLECWGSGVNQLWTLAGLLSFWCAVREGLLFVRVGWSCQDPWLLVVRPVVKTGFLLFVEFPNVPSLHLHLQCVLVNLQTVGLPWVSSSFLSLLSWCVSFCCSLVCSAVFVLYNYGSSWSNFFRLPAADTLTELQLLLKWQSRVSKLHFKTLTQPQLNHY